MARYRIVPERSRVWIDARSNVHPIHSETDGLGGWLDLAVPEDGRVDPTASAAGHLELPVERLRSGNPLQDRELRRRIDARRFPGITGDLAVMEETDVDGRYLVSGDLTFRGVTRRHRDQMALERIDERTLRLSGQSTFDIRDFGKQPPRILMLKVEPVVAVRVEITAEQEG
jgi:polyisoprenoid-binding protein YceI